MDKIWSKGLILFLVVAGLAITGIRYLKLKPGQFPTGDSVWKITVTSAFDTTDKQTTIQVPLPVETRRTRIVKHSYSLPNFSLHRVNRSDKMSPFLVVSTHKKGHHKLDFQYTIHVKRQPRKRVKKAGKPVSADALQNYLKHELNERVNLQWVEKRVDQLKLRSPDKDKYVLSAFNYVTRLNKLPSQFYQQRYSRKALKPNAFDKSLMLATLLRANQIPTRIITGLRLAETLDGDFHYWVQAYISDQWQSFDPFYNFKTSVPSNYLIFKYDAKPFLEPSGTQSIKTDVDITESDNTYGMFTSNIKSIWEIFDLTRLPSEVRDNIIKLLLLPFGVILTVMLRQLTGIHSYGTFTPTLLALALSIGDIRVTGTLFLIVAILTYAGRLVLPRKMLRVPRVSAVFTIVALALIMGISLLDYYNLNPAGATLLLPIVILATLLDRFYTTWDDNGKKLALIRLAWTALFAICCYPIVTYTELGAFMLIYPELHLLTLASVLLIYKTKKLAVLNRIPEFWLGNVPKKPKHKVPAEGTAGDTAQSNQEQADKGIAAAEQTPATVPDPVVKRD